MPPKSREQRLFGAACLRLALEAKVADKAGGLEIYEATLADLGVSDDEVEIYLATHREEVRSALAAGRRAGGGDA